MKSTYFIIFSLFVLLSACTSGGNGPDSARDKAENEDEAILKYSSKMIANPRTQAEIDENTILSFLIDSLLDFQRAPSGIYYQIEKTGQGAYPNEESIFKVHYQGTYLDGRVFDSSYQKGKPIEFTLDRVIRGWGEALLMLKPGGKGTFIIPSALAYGQRGYPGLIPPNTVLVFDIELISFQ